MPCATPQLPGVPRRHSCSDGTCRLLQGYFDEDSMEEFIASETDESSMSLTSEDEKAKRYSIKTSATVLGFSFLCARFR